MSEGILSIVLVFLGNNNGHQNKATIKFNSSLILTEKTGKYKIRHLMLGRILYFFLIYDYL